MRRRREECISTFSSLSFLPQLLPSLFCTLKHYIPLAVAAVALFEMFLSLALNRYFRPTTPLAYFPGLTLAIFSPSCQPNRFLVSFQFFFVCLPIHLVTLIDPTFLIDPQLNAHFYLPYYCLPWSQSQYCSVISYCTRMWPSGQWQPVSTIA